MYCIYATAHSSSVQLCRLGNRGARFGISDATVEQDSSLWQKHKIFVQ
jgi:hypothetical protein